MSDLFVPDNSDERIESLLTPRYERAVEYDADTVLVFSMGVGIYFLPGFDREPMYFSKRDGVVRDFCMHDGRLLDCGNYNGIIDTLSGDTLVETKEHNTAIASHYNKLFRGSFGMVFHNDMVIAYREDEVSCFCEFNKDLYDSGTSGIIYSSFKEDLLAERDDKVADMEVHDNRVYDCSQNGVFDTKINQKIGHQGHVTSLCSHQGFLYGGSYRKIVDVFSNVDIYKWGEGFFNCMISVPKSCLEDYLK